jgi:hypothetical protein
MVVLPYYWDIRNNDRYFFVMQAKAYADNFKWKGPVPEYD